MMGSPEKVLARAASGAPVPVYGYANNNPITVSDPDGLNAVIDGFNTEDGWFGGAATERYLEGYAGYRDHHTGDINRVPLGTMPSTYWGETPGGRLGELIEAIRDLIKNHPEIVARLDALARGGTHWVIDPDAPGLGDGFAGWTDVLPTGEMRIRLNAVNDPTPNSQSPAGLYGDFIPNNFEWALAHELGHSYGMSMFPGTDGRGWAVFFENLARGPTGPQKHWHN